MLARPIPKARKVRYLEYEEDVVHWKYPAVAGGYRIERFETINASYNSEPAIFSRSLCVPTFHVTFPIIVDPD